MIKRIFQISNLLLITLAIYFGVIMFYKFVGIRLHHFDLSITPQKETAITTVRPVPPISDYNVIVSRNLFNAAKDTGKKKPEQKVDIDALKQTDLNLKLWGTVSTEDRKSSNARAVIEQTQLKKQALYRIGDTVENAKIIEILRNTVILAVNGRQEKLTIAEKKATRAGEESRPAYLPPPVYRREPRQRISLQRSQINTAFNNINKLMSEVKIRPYFKAGTPAGFIVSNIAPDSIVRDMGLKSGDIVTSINGRQIKSADDAMAFYEHLKAGDKISIQIKRRGRPQTIEYTVKDEGPGK